MFLCPYSMKMKKDVISFFHKIIRNLYGNFTICEYVLCYNQIEAGGKR